MRFGRKKRAAVLGCGPAGLFAVHALIEKGWEVKVFSKKRRSEMFGAQYLHAPIPGLTEHDPVTVDYRLTGTVDGYREKVYGPTSTDLVSVQSLMSSHLAWDIREAYYNAWDRYSHLVTEVNVTPEFLGVTRSGNEEGGVFLAPAYWDYIINTIPLPQLCYGSHNFQSASVWALGDAPERGQQVKMVYMPPNTVLCNGSRDTGWYRASNVFGYKTVEWPGNRKPPLSDVAEVTKPTSTNCNCYRWKGKFIKVGRYGAWKKGVLSHHAYEEAAAL